MGDIADMMLEGSMCEQCGEYMGEGNGYPRLCGSCSRRPGNQKAAFDEEPRKPKQPCTVCGRHVKGLADHMRDKHGVNNER